MRTTYISEMALLKIAHVVHSFGNGGMEKGIATLVNNASPFITHIIVCLTRSGEMARLLPPETQILELEKPAGNSIWFYSKLVKLLKDLKPDVVHTRNWAGTDAIIAARLAGIKAIVHSEHGFGSENPYGDNIKRKWAHRVLSPLVREYVCVSKPLKGWLENQISVRKPVTQIYNGVDTEIFKPGACAHTRKRIGIPQDALVIGTVANLYPIKDLSTMIMGFNKLRCKMRNAYLVLVGEGPEREKLEMLSDGGILFLGNRSDVPDLMRIFDIYALSSINEGISNTILEAMATGLPVVASAVGGNVELIEDEVNGKLFPAGNSDALCSKLLDYDETPQMRISHGLNGRYKVLKFFSIGSMIKNYELIWYRTAIRRN